MVFSRMKLPLPLLNSEAFMLGRIRGRLVKRLMEEHAKLGLRFGSGTILICIEDVGPLSQRELSELLEVDPSELVRHIDLLEKAGLVQRLAHGEDRRINSLHITGAGRELRKNYDRMILRVENEMFGALPDDVRAGFIRTLQTLFEG